MKLAPKLTILFLLLSITPTAIVGYLAYENGRRTIVRETMDHLVSINIFKSNEVKRWIEDNKSNLEQMAQRPLVRQFAGVLSKHDAPDPAYHRAKGSVVEEHLRPRLKYGDFLELFVMCPRHGHISASTDEKQEGKYRDTFSYFIEGKTRTYVQGVYYSPELEQPVITVSTPIKDKQGDLVGVLAGRLDLGELSKIISLHSGNSPTEDTYLVNGFNFFVTEPRFGQGYALKKAVRTEGVEAGLSGKDGTGFYKDYRGVPVIGAYKWLPEFNMTIITEIDQAEAFAPVVRLAWGIAGIAFAISVVVSLLGLFFARTITRPILTLQEGVVRFGQGKKDVLLSGTGSDEIGVLAREFNQMAKAISDQEAQLRHYSENLENVVKERTSALQESEERFRLAAESSTDLIYEWDIKQRVDWFGKIDELLDYAPGEFPRTLEAWANKVHPDDLERVMAAVRNHLEKKAPYDIEYRIRKKDGTYNYWWARGAAVRDQEGNPFRWIGAVTDITERRRAEEHIRKLNRTLAMLSDINQAIVRIRDPQALFEQACRIAVEKGNFPLTWIGLLDPSAQRILPVASAGKSDGYLEKINISLKEEPRNYCPIDSALRKGESEICDIIGQDVDPVPCQENALALGLRSSVSFPLMVLGNIRGAINFYADEPHFFDEEENKLLEELAMDISFAMEFAEREAARKRAEEEIVTRNEIANIFLTSTTDEETYNELLGVVLKVMESKYGVVGYIDEDGALVVPSMSRHIWNKCQVPDKSFIFKRDKWGHSSWPRAIREKKSNYTNVPSTLTPEGHISVLRHISMPIIFQEEVIGLIQVANKETDYTEKDVELLELLGNRIIAPILNARLQRDRQERQRKRAEEEIIRLNAELEQRVFDRTAQLEAANKEMEAFAYSVSHDLRAPLRAVDGYTRILLEEYATRLNEDAQGICGNIRDGAQRMGKLIDDLLAFSRLSRAEMQTSSIDMHRLASSVFFELTTPERRESIDFRLQPLPRAEGDPTMIRQVWMNLISNALKFSSKRERPTIEIGCEQGEKENTYYIRDNGAGFDKEFAHKLFGVFQRLHSTREFEGTGVGLAIVQRIVHRHAGRTWAEGETDKGATIYFTMPKKGEHNE